MSLVAPVVDGKLQTSSASSDSLKTKKNNGVVNSDTFLTLLVAEMQNQDPLEPTSNTEWVSQYATFTQVEQIGEMADTMNNLRANSLVGQEVIMKVTSQTTGETSYKRGIVDYIVMEEGKALLNIDGANYSIDDLDTVASPEYFDAYDFYTEFTGKMDTLPTLSAIDKSYESTIGEIYEMYSNMNENQKKYMEAYAPLYLESYKKYIERMADYGITFEKETVKETTIDDVMAEFNKRMDEIMTKLSSIDTSTNTVVAQTANVAKTETKNEEQEAQSDSQTQVPQENKIEESTTPEENAGEETSPIPEEALDQLTKEN